MIRLVRWVNWILGGTILLLLLLLLLGEYGGITCIRACETYDMYAVFVHALYTIVHLKHAVIVIVAKPVITNWSYTHILCKCCTLLALSLPCYPFRIS